MDSFATFSLLEKNGLFPPETLTIAITGQCNLRCAHCWVDAGLSSSAAPVPKRAIQRVIEDFAALGGTTVRLTGGEPLLHPDCFELLAVAGIAGLNVLLQTNGILFDDENLQRLQALALEHLNIEISLDGATAATHDFVRGAGSYEQTLQGIGRLTEHGFASNIVLLFTEMRHNLSELPALFLLADRLGLGLIRSGCLVTGGRAKSDNGISLPEPAQYLGLLQHHADNAQFRHLYKKFGNVSALEWCVAETSQHGCTFARNPYLTAQGALHPCLLFHDIDYAVVNVFETGLSAALTEAVPRWARLQGISRQRAVSLPECQDCFLLKSCAGGCMGRAWESFGDLMVAEDRCLQRQTVLRWKAKNNLFPV